MKVLMQPIACQFSSTRETHQYLVGQLTTAGQTLIVWLAKPFIYVQSPHRLDPTRGVCRILRRNDAMKNFMNKVKNFLQSEDGPTAVEYAIMLALIVIVCLTAITAVGSAANSAFTNIAGKLQTLPN